MTEIKDRSTRYVADAGWCSCVCRAVNWIVSKLPHEWIEDTCFVRREKVYCRAVRRKTNGFVLVDAFVLGVGLPEAAAELSAHGVLVVGSPRIVDAGVHNRQSTRHHGRSN